MVNTSNSKTEINTFNVLGNPHSMPLWTSSCSYTIAPRSIKGRAPAAPACSG